MTTKSNLKTVSIPDSENVSINNRTGMTSFEKQTEDLVNQMENIPLEIQDKKFFNIVFQTEEYKKIAESKLAIVNTQIEYRRKALVMLSELRIEELRKFYESKAVEGGIAISAQTEMHIRELIAEREVWANSEVDKFLANYESAVTRMEKIKSPIAKTKEQERLNKTLEDFYDTIAHFNEEFKQTLKFDSTAPLH